MALLLGLSNIGGGVVTISGVALSGDFTQTNNCGMSCQLYNSHYLRAFRRRGSHGRT